MADDSTGRPGRTAMKSTERLVSAFMMVTGQADSSAARKWNLKAPRLDWSFLDLSRLWSVLGGLPDWSRLRSGF